MNQQIRQRYTQLLEFLGHALGPDYEAVLHDIKKNSGEVVAIANGQISGRRPGSPLTQKALQLIAGQVYRNQDYVVNYAGVSVKNKLLRSSTFFIKDERGNLEGLLCLNFDDSRHANLCKDILKLCHPDEFVERYEGSSMVPELWTGGLEEAENFPEAIDLMAAEMIQRAMTELAVPPERMTQEEKLEVVRLLNCRGLFLIRGSVGHVAKALNSSEASIYRYLNQVKREDEAP